MGCGAAQPNCKPGAQPITVTIIDSCPTCSFNVPVPLFATLADPKWGVLPVSYQQVRWQGLNALLRTLLCTRLQCRRGGCVSELIVYFCDCSNP